MTSSGHAHRQHYDMAYRVTRERALNAAKKYEVRFLYGAYIPDFELILTVKMETRHPIEGSFGSEFPEICSIVTSVEAGERCTASCRLARYFTRKRRIFKWLLWLLCYSYGDLKSQDGEIL